MTPARPLTSAPIQRRLTAVSGLVATVSFAGLSAIAALGEPGRWELESFRAANELPDWLGAVLWPLMQYGALAAIPVVAAGTWLLGRRRRAVSLALAALVGYLLAKVVKQIVRRGRPADFLGDVIEREDFGVGSLGYPSGHAVVAATITTILLPVMPPRLRVAAVVLTTAVLFGRVYIGGHLALDMVGGAALGVMLGVAANLIVDEVRDEGRPARGRSS